MKPCCDSTEKLKRGVAAAWSSKQEDQKLSDSGTMHGLVLERGNFCEEEDDLIIRLHALLGNRWSLIAGRLPGRNDKEVKKYWNSHLKQKVRKMGIDPMNYRISDYLNSRKAELVLRLQDNTTTAEPSDAASTSSAQHHDDHELAFA